MGLGDVSKVAQLLIQVEKFINSPEGQKLIADAKALAGDLEQVVHSEVLSAPASEVPAKPE